MAEPADGGAAQRPQHPSRYREARSVADITRANVQAMRKLDEAENAQHTVSDRFANLVARACGHIAFAIVHAIAFGGWMLWNTFGTPHPPDPYPFTLLTLWASAEGIFLMSFVLISQNYQARISERRNQLDLQINLLAEQENSRMLVLLEDIALKTGALTEGDAEIGALVQAAEPEQVVRQIDEAYDDGKKGG
ncbi:DUF1003 domain-containing protein [Ramlibacter sp.]|uniref:DUF1003 domain-containing protein n=1 Tax=Ramlibacter sp. TaxID=1917967 RepID=UPI002FC6566C